MGQLYKRGEVWWIKYYVNGRPIRESTRTTKDKEARNLLKDREGRAVSGLPIPRRLDRIRYDELADDLRRHYTVTGKRNLDEAGDRLKPLDCFFKSRRIINIDATVITQYIEQRQAEGIANGTINRELNVLSRMLRLGYERSKVTRVPIIHQLKEADPRKGFFERNDFENVRQYLRPDLQVAATIAYTYGWRIQSEILRLQLSQIDLMAGTLRLEPGTTKNREGRMVYLSVELRGMLEGQISRVHGISRQLSRVVPHLFPHLWNGRRLGEPLKDFRKSWMTACTKAGLVGMLRHDFRRTAVRNLVNAGVPERVAMKVTGHKTRSVFDRYHIVSPADLQEATRRLTGTIRAQSYTVHLASSDATMRNSSHAPVAQSDRAAVS